MTSATADSITFSISDPALSSKGLPGKVDASVTYSVTKGKWDVKMTGSADAKTRKSPPLASLADQTPANGTS